MLWRSFVLGTLLEAALHAQAREGYTLAPLRPFGARVLGLDLSARPPDATLAELQLEVARQGFLVFAGQHWARGEELVNVSSYFGGGEVLGRHAVHAEAVHEDVLRLSNQEAHGVRRVGGQWHHDGSFERSVFSHSAFHAQAMPPEGGETEFADTAAAFRSLPAEVREDWSRLASVNAYSGAVHPLVHRHPASRERVLFLHLSQTGAVIRWPRVRPPSCPALRASQAGLNAMDPRADARLRGCGFQVLGAAELQDLLGTVSALYDRPEHRAAHRYVPGDLVVVDNLAVAHRAAPSAHDPDNGRRVLHRATVRGSLELDPPPESGLPSFLHIFGENPAQDAGVWQPSDYYGAGFPWNASLPMYN